MDRIDKAFAKYPRYKFLPQELRERSNLDMPLSIGFGQTNSQPSTVKTMLRWLDTEAGQKILDVGSGSGWTAALLSCLVGPKGRVFAVEKIKQLKEFGENNCYKVGATNIKFHIAQQQLGWQHHAPYERILVSAAAEYLPKSLFDQLAVGGIMIIPIKNDIFEIHKTSGTSQEIFIHSNFVFVPLVHNSQSKNL